MENLEKIAKKGTRVFGYNGKGNEYLGQVLYNDLIRIKEIEKGTSQDLNKDHRHKVSIYGKRKDHVAYRPAEFIRATNQSGRGDARILTYKGDICGFAIHKKNGGYKILKYFG